MDAKERKTSQLKEMISHYSGGVNRDFAEAVGVSPQVVNNWLNRGTFDIEAIHKSFIDVSPDWLITGEGDMLRKQPTPVKYANTIQEGTPAVNEYPLKTPDRKLESQTIPIYDIEATASILEQGDINGQIIDYITLPNISKCDGAVTVRGESMTPIIQQGDLVLYKVYRDFSSILYGKMYLVQVQIEGDTLIMIKYVRKVEGNPSHILLCSENPDHAPMEVSLENVRSLALIKVSIRYHVM